MFTDAAEPARDWRGWLAAALRDGCPPADIDAGPDDELLVAARQEGVLSLWEWRWRNGPGWNGLQGQWRQLLSNATRASAAQWLLRERELQKIAAILSRAGVETLLLKGNALAFWLYPAPYLRDCGDIDLLFSSRANAERALDAVATLGYQLVFVPGETHYEMTARRVVDGINHSELDLHCRLLNATLYADTFEFGELWGSAISLPGMGSNLRGLSPLHALAHACMNRALDLQNRIPDRLKLLWDIHLLLAKMDAPDWDAYTTMARSKKLCGISLHSLFAAELAFGSRVPTAAMDTLQGWADVEIVDYHRLGDWRYMQWQNFKAIPTVGGRILWAWERLLPGRGQLGELYGEGSRWRLLLRRAGSALSKLR
jgi:hypothetical protein